MNQSSPAEPIPPKPPETFEDAGTRALSDALRSSFAIIKVVMIGLVLVFLGSGFFTVGTQEKAIILRLGKPVGTDESDLLGPGPHWAFPYPIDEVVKIPVAEVQTLRSTVGWYKAMLAPGSNQEMGPDPYLDPTREGYLLTADGNIIHVEGTLRYRIREPGLAYVFDFVNSSNSVQHAFDSALVFAASRFTVDDALTQNTTGFREAIRQRLEELIDAHQLGIQVDQVAIRSIPPRQLTTDFEAVINAEVRASQTINEAKTDANETVNKAQAQAQAQVREGDNRRNLEVEILRAEATNFLALLPVYRRNPELFKRQQQIEMFQQVLTNATVKMVVPDQLGGRPVQLRLLLNREREREQPAAEESP